MTLLDNVRKNAPKWVKAAEDLSDALHKLEADGIELPKYVDDAWSDLSLCIQEALKGTCRKCGRKAGTMIIVAPGESECLPCHGPVARSF